MAFTFGSFQRTVQGVVAVSALAVSFAVSPILTSIAQAGNIKGAGATFPQLLYEDYTKAFNKQNPKVQVSYQAVGSGAGIRQTIAGVVDFGGSDAAMTDAQMSEGKAGERGVILIPTAGGAVVPVYNVSGVDNLNLSPGSLAGIFSGKITKWDDAKIKEDNPNAKLPSAKINTVVRADGSGTTFVFTNHLSTVDSYFKGRVGVGTAPKWSNDPLKGKGNAGVASGVGKTPNSIGYVEFSFVKTSGLKVAGVRDGSGKFVQPSAELTNEAISSIKFPDNLRAFDGNPSKGYPIVGLTWMMFYKQYPNAQTAADVKTWAKWVLSEEGQKLNGGREFARIDAATVQRALQKIEEIK